jgi:hypothetical protein
MKTIMEMTAKQIKHHRAKPALKMAACFLASTFLLAGPLPVNGTYTCYAYEQLLDKAVIFKSDMVWRADDKGDYSVPVLTSGTHEPSHAVAASGTIESITANWIFEGKATLEVSANNGKNYVQAVNGVPLDFSQDSKLAAYSGKQLMWRAIVFPDSHISEIRIGYTDASGVAGNLGTPELAGFKFRKLAVIARTLSGSEGDEAISEDLFNHQVRVVVEETSLRGGLQADEAISIYCEGGIEADFKDIRFTAADGKRVLPHYLESVSGLSPERAAVFWVKIPQIPPKGVPIYMYYGNAHAKDISAPEDVFYVYDDFSKAELNAEKWDAAPYAGGSYALNNGLLKLDAVTLKSKNYPINNAIIEFSAALEPAGEIRAIIRGSSDNPARTQIAYASVSKDIEHSIVIGSIVKVNTPSPPNPNTLYHYRVIAKGQDLDFARYSITTPWFSDKQAQIRYTDTNGLERGYLGIATAGAGRGDRVAYIDWIRVRALADVEPALTKPGDQEKVNTAWFSGTALTSTHALTTGPAGHTAKAVYMTPLIKTACNISAVLLSLQGPDTTDMKDITISLSLDNGLTWLERCTNNKSYNAAEDFNANRLLKARLDIKMPVLGQPSVEIQAIKLLYSQGPVVKAENVSYKGATGPNGTYIAGDILYVEWDNSAKGDNNPDIISASCNLKVFEGPEALEMRDKNQDNKWTARHQFADGIKAVGNAYVMASNACGITVQDGHILVVNTREGISAVVEEEPEQVQDMPADTAITEEPLADTVHEQEDAGNLVFDQAGTFTLKEDLAGKNLIIGSGTGAHVSRVIIKDTISPYCKDIIIRKGGELVQANDQAQHITGDLIIQDGGTLTNLPNKASKQYTININARNIVLKPGSTVSAYAKGYSAGEARKAGAGRAGGKYISKASRGGGNEATERVPSELGAGGSGSQKAKGGAGGGSISLTAREEFSISGIINADGQAGEASLDKLYDGAGGAGGSIYLAAQKFSGAGAQITATGGSGNKSGGAGAGGRIHIKAPSGKISGTLNANGGSGLETNAGSVIVE